MKREEYVERICKRITKKSAREALCEELNDHIDQKMDELMAQGLNADEAEQAAIDGMGDAEQIAQGMNRATVAWYDVAKYILLALLVYFVIVSISYIAKPGSIGIIGGADGPTAIYVTVQSPVTEPLIVGLVCFTVILFVYSGYKKNKRAQ